MRLRNLRYVLVIGFGLVLLDSPRSDAAGPIIFGSCNASDCLTNSAVAQRIQPTTVGTDDHGDVTFFASQSGQLPNVMFILDNQASPRVSTAQSTDERWTDTMTSCVTKTDGETAVGQ